MPPKMSKSIRARERTSDPSVVAMQVQLASEHVSYKRQFAKLAKENGHLVSLVRGSHGCKAMHNMPDLENTDVVLFDIDQSFVNGYQSTRWLQQKYPKVRIIAVAEFLEQGFVSYLKRQGFHGLMSKQAELPEIFQTLRLVVQRGTWFPDIKQKIDAPVAYDQANRLEWLNSTEMQILRLLSLEYDAKEIGDLIHMSPRTVEGYRTKIKQKLNVKGLAGMAVYAVGQGLLQLPKDENLESHNQLALDLPAGNQN